MELVQYFSAKISWISSIMKLILDLEQFRKRLTTVLIAFLETAVYNNDLPQEIWNIQKAWSLLDQNCDFRNNF